MTNKELIAELRRLPPNDEVLIGNSQNNPSGFYLVTETHLIVHKDHPYVLINSNHVRRLPE